MYTYFNERVNLQITHDVRSTYRLRNPSKADNLRPPQISPLEEISPSRSLGDLFLKLIRMLNHGDRFVGVEVRVFLRRREPEQRSARAFSISSSHMPPRALGR